MEKVARPGFNHTATPRTLIAGGNGDKFVLNPMLEFLDAYFGLVATRRRIAVVRFDPLGGARILLHGTWFDLPADRRAKKTESKIGRFAVRSIRASGRAGSNSGIDPGRHPAANREGRGSRPRDEAIFLRQARMARARGQRCRHFAVGEGPGVLRTKIAGRIRGGLSGGQ